jgi:hypothetical protein
MQDASFRERLLATLVDAVVLLLGMAAAVGLGLGGASACARLRGTDDADETDQDEDEDREYVSPRGFRPGGDDLDDHNDRPGGIQHGIPEFLQSPLVHAVVEGASAGLAVANRNWRSPGFRVLGLRRVDACTGGPIGVRSVVVGMLFDRVRQAATRQLFRSRARRARDRLSELAPKLTEIEREHATDPQARQRAVAEFYKANAVHPSAGCGWQLAGPMLSQLVLAIAIRDGRTVYDRLTGTIVIVDR